MARYDRFTFLCSTSERRAIVELAARLQRSQSDAVRFVVLEAAKELAKDELAVTQSTEYQAQGGSHVAA